jgi:hypothetical protein
LRSACRRKAARARASLSKDSIIMHPPVPTRPHCFEHIDFRARILHVPRPKGGEAKAFDIPLSRAMILCLIRVLRIGRSLYPTQARVWVFPADSASGHLAEHKEDRQTLTKWGNDLRQTYRTVAQGAGIANLDIHLLMNHSVAGVNAGYITRSKAIMASGRRS